MPITVKNLNISTKLTNTANQTEKETSGNNKQGGSLSKKDKEILIQECLERVEALLAEKFDR